MVKMKFMEEKGPNAFLHDKERLKLCRYTIRHNYQSKLLEDDINDIVV